jgi:hypothetical protein
MATIQAYAPPCEHAEFYLRELDLREHRDQVRELLETGALPRLFTR